MGRPRDSKAWSKIAHMSTNTFLARALAAALHREEGFVRYAMQEMGITIQRPERTPAPAVIRREKWPEMALLYMQGHSYSAIGRIVGRDHATAMNAISKMQRHIDLTPAKRILPPRKIKSAPPKRVRVKKVLLPKPAQVEPMESDAVVEAMMQRALSIAKPKWKERSIAA